jgi:uncharacterized membrane protein YczE
MAKPPDELPSGYRQGLINALAIFIGFALVFLRYWAFEAPGEWTLSSLVATVLMGLALLLQVFTLYRALKVEDSLVSEYTKTTRWLFASIALMLASFLAAGVAFSGVVAR